MLLWVQCGANEGIPQKYVDDCQKVLDVLMEENDLIFGAADRKSTRLNSSHIATSRMPSSA